VAVVTSVAVVDAVVRCPVMGQAAAWDLMAVMDAVVKSVAVVDAVAALLRAMPLLRLIVSHLCLHLFSRLRRRRLSRLPRRRLLPRLRLLLPWLLLLLPRPAHSFAAVRL
jgi:hypothetical protein